MVLVQRGPQDTGKEYPRTVEDASLPSSSSSWPPLRPVSLLFSSACLPSVHLSFLLVNTPLPRPIRISTLAKRSVVSFKCYTLWGISSPSCIPFLSFLFLPFSFPSRSFLHFFYFFILFPFLYTLSLLLLLLVPYRKATREPSVSPSPLISATALCAARLSCRLRNQGPFESSGVGGGECGRARTRQVS